MAWDFLKEPHNSTEVMNLAYILQHPSFMVILRGRLRLLEERIEKHNLDDGGP